MPIARINKSPYYLTVKDITELPIIEKFIMYSDNKKNNRLLNSYETRLIRDYIIENIGDSIDYKFRYVDLMGKDAECATTEMILYHTYFFCNKTTISGSHRTRDTSSDSVSLNDISFPYNSWNSEILLKDLIIISGDLYYVIEYHKIEKIIGFFQDFKIILNDIIISFSYGTVRIEDRTKFSSLSVLKFYQLFDEKRNMIRYLRSIDNRNYKDFVFYINDKYLYSK